MLAAPSALLGQQQQNQAGQQHEFDIPDPPAGQLWSEKYRPTKIADMCYPAFANRIRGWLTNWERTPGGPPADTTSASKRAAMLSGPPGVGKTTTVYVVAREMGYEVVEFNASDHRSAKSLRETVGDLVDNRIFQTTKKTSASGTGGTGFFTSPAQKQAAAIQLQNERTMHMNAGGSLAMRKKFILLMDEVDGCDRGGAGEIIQLIKNSKCPIICTCNDRWHQKLRSLVNYCEDVRFTRAPAAEIANFIQHRVLANEGIQNLTTSSLISAINSCGSDIRSILNNLQIWTRSNRNMDSQQLTAAAVTAEKNVDMGLFEAAEKFFASAANSSNSQQQQDRSQNNVGQPLGQSLNIEEQMRLYYDSELIDLFVHENYLSYRPDRKDWMKSAAAAANSLATADVISRQVFSEQNWGAGGAAAYRGSVYPCAMVRGQYQNLQPQAYAGGGGGGRTRFPSWLGFNSTSTKFRRMATCLVKQGQDPVDGFGVGSSGDFCLDYAPVLSPRLAEPIAVAVKNNTDSKPAIAESIKMMDTYNLQREDWDNLLELIEFKKMARAGPFAGRLNFVREIPGAVKAGLTREFNKTMHSERSVAKMVAGKGNFDTQVFDGEGDENNDNDGDESEAGSTVAGKKASPRAPAAKKAAGAKASPAAILAGNDNSAAAAVGGKKAGKGKGAKAANAAPKSKPAGKNGVRRQRQGDE